MGYKEVIKIAGKKRRGIAAHFARCASAADAVGADASADHATTRQNAIYALR